MVKSKKYKIIIRNGELLLKNFFTYNWQVRQEWFEWCKHIKEEELTKSRVGGVGSILETLFHIVEVEYSWIRAIQRKEDIVVTFKEYDTLDKIMSLSKRYEEEITEFLNGNLFEMKNEHVYIPWDKNTYIVDDILHHLVAHEIHHIGQLSVWARELGKRPVPANFIGRNIRK